MKWLPDLEKDLSFLSVIQFFIVSGWWADTWGPEYHWVTNGHQCWSITVRDQLWQTTWHHRLTDSLTDWSLVIFCLHSSIQISNFHYHTAKDCLVFSLCDYVSSSSWIHQWYISDENWGIYTAMYPVTDIDMLVTVSSKVTEVNLSKYKSYSHAVWPQTALMHVFIAIQNCWHDKTSLKILTDLCLSFWSVDIVMRPHDVCVLL